MKRSASPAQTNNPFRNGGGKAEPFTNGDRETHFEENVGRAVSRDILEEVLNNIIAVHTTPELTQGGFHG